AVYMWLRPEAQFAASTGQQAPLNAHADAGTPAADQPEQAIPTPPALSDLGRAGAEQQADAGASASPDGTMGHASPSADALPESSTADAGASATAGQPATDSTSVVPSGADTSAV